MAERPRSKTAPKKKKKRRLSGRTWFYGLFFTAVIAIICGIIGYLLIVLNGERILSENANKLEFGEASIIYDADKNEIARLMDSEQNRELAEFSEIPEQMLNAIVATEDQRFYQHSGIDFFAIGRAIVKDVIARSAVEGGSTITQQLAKNVFLTADKTFFRKATEASIAVALEHQKSKPEILTMYLNRIFFGKNIYGVKHAASYYFDAELKDLELWQVATLAAMPKAPNRYSPIKNPEDSMNRRAVVLKLMHEQGYITAEEMKQAKAVVYVPPAHLEQNTGEPYPAFVDYVVEEAMEVTNLSEEELRIGGYRIYTTLNPQAQKSIEKQFDDDDNFEKSKDDRQVEGAMVIIDHRDGAIKGLTGGRDYVKKGLNRVNVTRQPGSSFKPIVAYGPALETGDFYPWTILDNDQKCFGDYCPYDRWGATSVSMTQAIKDSRNLAAVWMLNEIGLKRGKAFAEKLGFTISENDYNLTLALGSNAATPMQMATAYSVFANGGKSVDPHSIIKIEGKDRDPYTYKAPESKQLMSPETAWYLTEMMQTVVQKGGSGARAAINRPVAGKTGTTQFGTRGSGVRDAWFVGYTPEWTAAVWMGYDKTDENHVLDNGSVQSAALFSKVMRDAMKGVPNDSFKKPQGVKENKPPATVSNFNAVYLPEEAKVQLSWDPLTEGEITYEVHRKEASEQEFALFVDSLKSTVDDMSVFPGMTYEYYVVAYDAKNNLRSEPTPTIKVEIPAAEIEVPEIPMEPDPNLPGEENPDGELPGGENPDPGNGGENLPDPGGTLPPELPDGTDPGDGGQGTPPPDTGTNDGSVIGNAGGIIGNADNGGNTQGTGG
ncbi:PBP1A family penicillin-binding protein [Paenibacillus harenae]|uniref:PBP1A family penicillin-binding protein n=1 Tax=Paenibacillus harenae TaxID=306543 RepID=UPI000421620E|nr:PBP1A family penicillin-binding protein [Paenibacillus harenae]